jgi:hypothetical protein
MFLMNKNPLSSNKTQWDKYKYLAFILVGLLGLFAIIFLHPPRYGDGFEYLGMTISVAQHGTPELRDVDIAERRALVNQYSNPEWNLPINYDHAGYFTAKNGNEYSYHFWIYSVVCSPFFIILKTLRIDPINVFLAVNIILILFLFWWIIYRACLTTKRRIWLIIFSLVSPIWLYLPWSHPEVFIYVFLLIGLIEVFCGNIPLGSLFIALASTQGSPLTIIAGASMVYVLWLFITKRLTLGTTNIVIFITTVIFIILPYSFYLFNFGTPSLIAGGSGSASTIQAISFSKIASLFFDPNFGLIIYVPLLLVVLVILLVKRNLIAYLGIITMVTFTILCATQYNWNSGMMYINRYAIWIMPVLIIATLSYFDQLILKWFQIFVASLLLTTGIVTSICIVEHDGINWLKFGPMANFIIAVDPSIYNPPFEVFAERFLGKDGALSDKVPLELANSNGLRKSLVFEDSGKRLVYHNGSFQFTADFELMRLLDTNSSNDIIILTDGKGSFISGWYPLETTPSGQKYRWIDQNAKFGFLFDTKGTSAEFQMNIASFSIPRDCLIYINGKESYKGNINTSRNNILFQAEVKSGMNYLEIISLQPADKPSDLKLKNPDNRDLTFAISSIQITPSSP